MFQNSVFFTDSFQATLFFLLLTYAEIKAFNWLKALFSLCVSTKNKEQLKRTVFFGTCKPANYVQNALLHNFNPTDHYPIVVEITKLTHHKLKNL